MNFTRLKLTPEQADANRAKVNSCIDELKVKLKELLPAHATFYVEPANAFHVAGSISVSLSHVEGKHGNRKVGQGMGSPKLVLSDEEKNTIGVAVGIAADQVGLEVLFKPSGSTPTTSFYRIFHRG